MDIQSFLNKLHFSGLKNILHNFFEFQFIFIIPSCLQIEILHPVYCISIQIAGIKLTGYNLGVKWQQICLCTLHTESKNESKFICIWTSKSNQENLVYHSSSLINSDLRQYNTRNLLHTNNLHGLQYSMNME